MKANPSQQDQEILKLLESLKTIKADYPPELLAKRRSALIGKYELLNKKQVKGSQSPEREVIVELLKDLEQVKAVYPPVLLAKQRSAFLNQAAKHRKVGWLETLHTVIRNWFTFGSRTPTVPMTNHFRGSLIVLTFLAVTFAGFLLFGSRDQSAEPSPPPPTQQKYIQPVPVVPTTSLEIKQTTCAPESTRQPCITHGFVKSPDQDSWISNEADSWIKLDTGQNAVINKVELDRVSLGGLKVDFTISVAHSDNHYQQVYDSRSGSSAPAISGKETIQVSLEPVVARFVIVEVASSGMVINELRAYSVTQPSTPQQFPDATSTASQPILVPSRTQFSTKSSPLPTKTALPTNTSSPTSTPSATNTPLPTSTFTATNTPLPTSTFTATSTPLPTSTFTATNTPLPTSTSSPTVTQTPKPTDTPLPTSTQTPTNTLPPTSTVLPTGIPTSTPAP